MTSLAQMRAQIKKQAERTQNNGNASRKFGDGASYPFWNIPLDSTAEIRFLPDGDPDNVFFFQKREVIRLPFEGVLGQSDKRVEVQVPCNEMFGGKCPVIETIRPWWNDPAKKDLARVYWKKASFIYQGFVVKSELTEDEVPENPIRRFVIGKSIHDKVLAHINDEDVDVAPTDYEMGSDFRITRTKKGDFSNYDSSSFARRARALTQEERDAIEKFGLSDLKEFKGTPPTEDHLRAIAEMMDDSVNGRPFDMAKYGKYYRPFGFSYEGADAATTTSTAASTPASTPTDDEVTVLGTGGTNGDIDSIIRLAAKAARNS